MSTLATFRKIPHGIRNSSFRVPFATPSMAAFPHLPIKIVVFDIYNTIVVPKKGLPDAPIEAFDRTFKHFDLKVKQETIKKDYGNEKGFHLDCILRDKYVNRQTGFLRRKFGEIGMRKEIFKIFEEKQCEILADERYCMLVPGFFETLEDLTYMGVEYFCTTSGFNTKMQNFVLKHMKRQGFVPHIAIASDTLKKPRPDPMGMHKIMEICGISSASQMVKIGDTVADLHEAANTSPLCPVIGVEGTISEKELLRNGAWYVMKNITELPSILHHIEQSRDDNELD